MPILRCVETPDRLTEPSYDPAGEPPAALRRVGGSLWGLGESATWVAGLVLALSALTGWYSGSGEGVDVAVIGWNTGAIGKVVFFIGLAAILVVALRYWGVELPAAVPESLVVIGWSALDNPRAREDDLEARRLLLRRPRNRPLDQPRRIRGSDRRRTAASVRRAIAIPTPSAAPASTSKG